jgi:hypothetical protein
MAVQYGVYFVRNGQVVRLPVNPGEIPVEHPTENSRYNVLGTGEIIVPRIPNLRQISFEGFFPQNIEPFVLTKNGFQKAAFYVELFTGYMNDRKPVRLVINRVMEDGETLFDTNMKVIVENFRAADRGGETGDIYYELHLSEHRPYGPQAVTITMPAAPTQPAVAVATPERAADTDIINVGDTVIANGKYWYSSWGKSPFGTANNKTIKVTRIVQNPTAGQIYPIHIGAWGWVQKGQLKKVT